MAEAAIAAHTDKGEHRVRYCGGLCNQSRGMRRLREEPQDDLTWGPEVEEAQADPGFVVALKPKITMLLESKSI